MIYVQNSMANVLRKLIERDLQ